MQKNLLHLLIYDDLFVNVIQLDIKLKMFKKQQKRRDIWVLLYYSFNFSVNLTFYLKVVGRKIGLLKKKNLYRKCTRLRKFKAFFFDKLFLVFTARSQSFSLIHEESLTPARPYSTDFSPNIFPSHALKTYWSFFFFFLFVCSF